MPDLSVAECFIMFKGVKTEAKPRNVRWDDDIRRCFVYVAHSLTQLSRHVASSPVSKSAAPRFPHVLLA